MWPIFTNVSGSSRNAAGCLAQPGSHPTCSGGGAVAPEWPFSTIRHISADVLAQVSVDRCGSGPLSAGTRRLWWCEVLGGAGGDWAKGVTATPPYATLTESHWIDG